MLRLKEKRQKSDRPGLNRRPLDLQSNALPLSYSRSYSPPQIEHLQHEFWIFLFTKSSILSRMIVKNKRIKYLIHFHNRPNTIIIEDKCPFFFSWHFFCVQCFNPWEVNLNTYVISLVTLSILCYYGFYNTFGLCLGLWLFLVTCIQILHFVVYDCFISKIDGIDCWSCSSMVQSKSGRLCLSRW